MSEALRLTPPPAPRFEVEPRDDKFYVVDRRRNVEMAPVFDFEVTAREIAIKATLGHPFFLQIPTVAWGAPYPRMGHTWRPPIDLGMLDSASW